MNHPLAAAIVSLLVTLLTAGLVLPVAQQSANSHMNPSVMLASMYFLVAVGVAGGSLARARTRWPWLLLSAVLGASGLTAWGLICQPCAAGG
jgi:hypothetical protein